MNEGQPNPGGMTDEEWRRLTPQEREAYYIARKDAKRADGPKWTAEQREERRRASIERQDARRTETMKQLGFSQREIDYAIHLRGSDYARFVQAGPGAGKDWMDRGVRRLAERAAGMSRGRRT